MENMIPKELEEKIKNAENLDEIINACAEAGIEVTKEQLEAELKRLENTELGEDDLEDVSGGLVVTTAVAAGAAAVAVGWAIYKYHKRKYGR